MRLCLAPCLSVHLPSRTDAATDPVFGGGQLVKPLVQSPPQQTSTRDVLVDTDHGRHATSEGSLGARGCCPGLSEVSHDTAPLHYPS